MLVAACGGILARRRGCRGCARRCRRRCVLVLVALLGTVHFAACVFYRGYRAGARVRAVAVEPRTGLRDHLKAWRRRPRCALVVACRWPSSSTGRCDGRRRGGWSRRRHARRSPALLDGRWRRSCSCRSSIRQAARARSPVPSPRAALAARRRAGARRATSGGSASTPAGPTPRWSAPARPAASWCPTRCSRTIQTTRSRWCWPTSSATTCTVDILKAAVARDSCCCWPRFRAAAAALEAVVAVAGPDVARPTSPACRCC